MGCGDDQVCRWHFSSGFKVPVCDEYGRGTFAVKGFSRSGWGGNGTILESQDLIGIIDIVNHACLNISSSIP
ncbi:MAG TPA: hypothetical protein DHV36_10255 [Desulfobacteraceae bacterium]|nr:hypothetical protein [Desulfobacteraceae bacterium]|tara:strand:- start:378 stop:593 length:216 start_codon:yes stop_codon:yes gene_type:complete